MLCLISGRELTRFRTFLQDLLLLLFFVYTYARDWYTADGVRTDDADGPGVSRDRVDLAWVINCFVFQIQ